MNIVKKLHSIAEAGYQKQITEAEINLDSVKESLMLEDVKDQEMLGYFGTQKVIGAQINIAAQAKKFLDEKNISLNDIKSICIKYDLKFLRSRFYKKEIPLKALNDLRTFIETNQLSKYNLQENLYVIAPASHFTLGPRPQKDPVLVYESTNGAFKIISQWGNDFNFLRTIPALLKANWPVLFVVSTLSIAALSVTLAIVTKNGWFAFGCIGLPFLIALIENDCETSRDTWNEPYKNY